MLHEVITILLSWSVFSRIEEDREMNSLNKSSRKSSGWVVLSIVFVLIISLLAILSVFIVRYSISKGVSTATNAFQEAFDKTKEDTYAKFKDAAYKLSENGHHVSNRVTISIHAVKEKSDLNVLKVSDVVYIVDDKNDTKNGTTSWLKVSGAGVFSVNMTQAEYVVDNVRQHVLVRVPRPVIDSSNITIDNAESLHFEENKWNRGNSIKAGEELAMDQLSEAKQRILEDFEANEQYSKLAESSTQSMLAALIKGINPDVKNLQVEVEFY